MVFTMEMEQEAQNQTQSAKRREQQNRAEKAVLTDREFSTYLDELKIGIEDLREPILDLGSGRTEGFAHGALACGISNVISLNPQMRSAQKRFERSEEKALYRLPEDEVIPPVAGITQELPFQDNSFKTIVSSYAVPLYIPKEDLEPTFKEIYRVLDEGGNAFLGPVDRKEHDKVDKKSEIERVLRSLNVPFEFKPHIFNDNIMYYVLHIHKPTKEDITTN